VNIVKRNTCESDAMEKFNFEKLKKQQIVIENAATGHEAWNLLKAQHVLTDSSSRSRLYMNFFNLSFDEGGDLKKHFTKFNEFVSDLKAAGAKFDDEVTVGVLLKSVKEVFPAVVTAIHAWDDKRKTVQAVSAQLLEEWLDKKGREETVALRTSKKCGFCHKLNHSTNNCLKKKNSNERRNS
jgi:gag-polypeptide of LTR copia-type